MEMPEIVLNYHFMRQDLIEVTLLRELNEVLYKKLYAKVLHKLL